MIDLNFLKDRPTCGRGIHCKTLKEVPRLIELLRKNPTLADNDIAKLWGYSKGSTAGYRRELTRANREGFNSWEEYVAEGRPFSIAGLKKRIILRKGAKK